MCIESYQNMLRVLVNKIISNNLKYTNSIIIGDNSSGKSDLLRQLVVGSGRHCYLIDSVNRSLDYKAFGAEKEIEIGQYKIITDMRIKSFYFNKNDSFFYSNGANGKIESIYFNYKEQVESLFEDFIGKEIQVAKIDHTRSIVADGTCTVTIDDAVVDLSSGYQALIRLFLEMVFFNDTLGEEEDAIAFIDELDEFLSPKNNGSILNFLMEQFPKINFVVTTHSPDLIYNSTNCNLILINDLNYEILDGNDYASINDVYDLFLSLYGKVDDFQGSSRSTDFLLRSLLYFKINNRWTGVEEEQLKTLEELTQLTTAQNLLLRQIKDW